MGQVIELIDGLQAKGKDGSVTVHKTVTLRRLTAGDVLAASAAAERAWEFNGKVIIDVSPTEMAAQRLCRMIASIGDIQGPLARPVLNKLSDPDLELLLDAASGEFTGTAEGVKALGEQLAR